MYIINGCDKMNEFGIYLKKLRSQKKLTLRNLAEQSGLSYSFIASLEKGRYNPSRETIAALAGPIGADHDELLQLAGFLPEIPTEDMKKNKHAHPIKIEELLHQPVTYQGRVLQEHEKLAIMAFLQTMSNLNQQ